MAQDMCFTDGWVSISYEPFHQSGILDAVIDTAHRKPNDLVWRIENFMELIAATPPCCNCTYVPKVISELPLDCAY